MSALEEKSWMNRLRELEARARVFEPSEESLGGSLSLLAGRAKKFVSSLSEKRAIFSKPSVSLAPNAFEEGVGLGRATSEMFDNLEEDAITTTSGRFFGYVPGGGLPAGAIGDFVGAVTNRYSGIYLASPAAVEMENQLVEFFRSLIGYPGSAWGTLLSGGTLSTVACFLAAKEKFKPRDRAKSVVYVTSEHHIAIRKALRIIGFDDCVIRTIGTDPSYRMDVAELRRVVQSDQSGALKPWIVIGNAGSTNTGSVDPLQEIAELCRELDLWFHEVIYLNTIASLAKEGGRKRPKQSQQDAFIINSRFGH